MNDYFFRKRSTVLLFCNGQLTPSFRETEKLGDFSSAALTFCICREVVDLDTMHSGRLSMGLLLFFMRNLLGDNIAQWTK